MSKCPFWSTTKSKVKCDNACPMYESSVEDTECIFNQHLELSKINFKEIVEDDFTYSQEKAFKLDFIEGSSY